MPVRNTVRNTSTPGIWILFVVERRPRQAEVASCFLARRITNYSGHLQGRDRSLNTGVESVEDVDDGTIGPQIQSAHSTSLLQGRVGEQIHCNKLLLTSCHLPISAKRRDPKSRYGSARLVTAESERLWGEGPCEGPKPLVMVLVDVECTHCSAPRRSPRCNLRRTRCGGSWTVLARGE